ncbi:E3 ubiquitin-protein ligase RING1 [Diplonema papillatum]|nr:E3 ubiquitin-protein ligase RING1 [Diplonema papillatum]
MSQAQYWCHTCKGVCAGSVMADGEVACGRCAGSFVERLDTAQDRSEAATFSPPPAPVQAPPQRPPVHRFTFTPRHMTFTHHHPTLDNTIMSVVLNDALNYPPPPRAAIMAAIDSLDTFSADDVFCSSNESGCSVCLEDWSVGDECICMPCSHTFHVSCLKTWLATRNTCPTCRHQLPTNDIEHDLVVQAEQDRLASERRRRDAQRNAAGPSASADP